MISSTARTVKRIRVNQFYIYWKDRMINNSERYGPFGSRREAVNFLRKLGWQKTAKGSYEHPHNKWYEAGVRPISDLMQTRKLFPRVRRVRYPKL